MNNSGMNGNTFKTENPEDISNANVPFNTPPAPNVQPEQTPEMTSSEQQTTATEALGQQEALPTMPQSLMPSPDPAIVPAAQTMEDQNPEIAVDVDKMEQAWVHQTEQVVERYSNDPRTEEIEVNKLKADYMAKRFNRHLGDRNS